MHKKLLLVMLVPVLALSLIVVGCGSDDDLFDGDPTFRGIQGSWESVWTGADAAPPQWFLATANQIMMMNPHTYEGGLAYRTGFTLLHQAGIRVTGLPATEVAYIDQRAFLDAMNAEIAAWLDAENYGWWTDDAPVGVTWVAGAGLEINGTTVPDLMDAWDWSQGTGTGIGWGTVQALNDLMFGNNFRQLETFFRGQLGVNFAWKFRNNNMMAALADPFVAGSRDAVGFVAAELGTIAPASAVFALDSAFDRVVTFRWDLVDWDTNEDRGTLHVMWLDHDSNAGDDLLIIFSSVGPYFWQDNLPLPIGVFARK